MGINGLENLADGNGSNNIEDFDAEDVPLVIETHTDDGSGDLTALPESDFDEEVEQ